MAQSLRNLSLAAMARKFWNNYQLDPPIPPDSDLYQAILKTFGQQVDNFKLPVLFKIELKLAIVEFGKRKISKDHRKAELELDAERPLRLDKALRECLPKYLHDHPIRAPAALQRHFPEEHQRRMVVDFFFALVLPNPRDDANSLRECWTSPTFLPIQSIFLDNFADIWSAIFDDLFQQFVDYDTERQEHEAIQAVYIRLIMISVSNETIPWFVFELLDCHQREKFFALRDTMAPDSPLTMVFSTLFCHWPWQYEAFDRCFAEKEELSNTDRAMLANVLLRKYFEERKALCTKMLPRSASFYLKVENFLEAKKLPRDGLGRGL